MSTLPMDTMNPGFKNGLLKFLQSPEALALGQGLLAGSQPNMHNPASFGSALALGLGNMAKAAENRKANEMKEKWLELSVGIEARKRHREDKGTKAHKSMSQKDRIVYAKFIKKYPQYAKDKPEDILEVAKRLGMIGTDDTEQLAEGVQE